MTPQTLSQIHAAAFTQLRPWSAAEFSSILDNPHTHLFTQPNGFAIVLVIAGEAELLSIAVDPAAQGQGIGHALMKDWMAQVNATEAFLDVAEDNDTARHLYACHGFAEAARRKAYYPRKGARSIDALLMRASF